LLKTVMRPALLFPVTSLWLAFASSPAICDNAALSDLPPVLPDPSLATGVRFPPGLTTAGVAQVGPSLRAASHARSACARTIPCAMATPAADQVALARRN
jgi:hypothetical protein